MNQYYSVSFNEKIGYLDISFTNGNVAISDIVNTKLTHIVFCQGRLLSELQLIRKKRGGSVVDLHNIKESFSSAWFYYTQNNFNDDKILLFQDAIINGIYNDDYLANLISQGNNLSVDISQDNFNLEKINITISIGKQIIQF
jgi:hypothetical protein